MTMKFAMTPRLAAVTLAAMLAVAACGGSDDATPGNDAAAVLEESQAEQAAADAAADGSATDVQSEAATAGEVSVSLDVVGDALSPLDNPDDDPAVGATAPVITGQSFDGTDVTIGGATNGPTMYVFLAHWCPHCNDEIPELVQLRDAGTLPDDLNIVGISTAVVDDRENYPPSEWIVEKDWTWPVLADTEAADAFQTYGGTGFPYTVLLDSEGAVLARKSGNESADRILSWIESSLQA